MRCHACSCEVEIPGGQALGFREECVQCRADLHVCLNCAHHDPTAYNGCRESSAERVRDPDRANRCDYFRPREASDSADRAGGAQEGASEAMSALEALFKKD